MHPHRHLAQLQPAPDAAGQHFGFKVVVTAAEPQLRQRRDRIGAEPALAVAARHTGFDLQPEVRESAPETAAARHVVPLEFPAADDQQVLPSLQQFQKRRQVLRVVLAVGVDRDHIVGLLPFEERERGQDRSPLAPVAAVNQIAHAHAFEHLVKAERQVGAAVVHDQHLLHLRAAAAGDVGDGRAVVVDRDHTPDLLHSVPRQLEVAQLHIAEFVDHLQIAVAAAGRIDAEPAPLESLQKHLMDAVGIEAGREVVQ